MIIHATKKALPLFSYLTPSKDVDEAKIRSNQNPLNSWHANYFNVNRKKMLLLVNDASLYTILIPDVNATRKKELDKLISEALKIQLKTDDFLTSLTDPYLEQLGEIEVATGYNRKVTSTSNHFILMLENYIFEERKALSPTKLASWLNEVPVSSLKHVYPFRELKAWLSGEEKPISNKGLVVNGKVKIDKTWDDFSVWQEKSNKVECEELDPMTLEQDYIRHSENLVNGFITYLEKEENLSNKVVRRHADNASVFMDFLMFSVLYTPLGDRTDLTIYFYWLIDKGIVMSDYGFNGQIAALKKFYQFLYYVNEIDAQELKERKENIRDSKEIIFDLLI